MAALKLVVNGRDLTQYLQTQQDAGLDVSNGPRIDPQFGGSTALEDGQIWVRDSAANKEWTVPLLLSAASADALNLLIQGINNDLVQGAQVQFTPDGASQPTWFDLERGRLDPDYDESLYRHNYCRASLRLWTRPYGHTGTSRLVASQAGTGALALPVTGVLGDVAAVGNCVVQQGSGIDSPYSMLPNITETLAWGFTCSPSPAPVVTAATICAASIGGVVGGTVVGASGRTASQYFGFTVNANANTNIGLYVAPTVTDYFQGKFRAFLSYTSSYKPTAVSFRFGRADNGPAVMNPTVMGHASAQDRFVVVDVGEVNIPYVSSGVGIATQCIAVSVKIASHAALNATPNVKVDSLTLIPVSVAAGLVHANASDFNQRRQHYIVNGFPTAAMWVGSIGFNYLDIMGAAGDAFPRVPVTGSPVASSLSLVVWPFSKLAHRGNDVTMVSLSVNERFRFMR